MRREENVRSIYSAAGEREKSQYSQEHSDGAMRHSVKGLLDHDFKVRTPGMVVFFSSDLTAVQVQV